MIWWMACLTLATIALAATVAGLALKVQRLNDVLWNMQLPHMRAQAAAHQFACKQIEDLDAENWGNISQVERDRIRTRMIDD